MKLLRRNLTWFEYLPYDNAGSDLNDEGEHTEKERARRAYL